MFEEVIYTEIYGPASEKIVRQYREDALGLPSYPSQKRGRYEDEPGFCKSASIEDIRTHDHILTPGRYVGVAPQPEDDEPFEEKMTRLAAEWREQQKEARKLDRRIAKNLKALGFGD